MPKSYSNDISRPIFSMSHDQFTSYDNAKPLMKILNEDKAPVLAADYVIKVDTNIKSDMKWNDVKKLVATIDAAYRSKTDIDEIFKMKQMKRKNSHKPDYIEIELPDKDYLINGDTQGYLVLIAHDKTNVIMKKYFDFVMSKLPTVECKGKSN